MGCGQSKIHLYPRKSKSKANGKKSGNVDLVDADAEEDDEGHRETDKELNGNGKSQQHHLRNEDDDSHHHHVEIGKGGDESALNGEITIPILRGTNLSLLQNQDILSSSQQNFFKMLDQKIDEGPDYDSTSETEIALEEARLNALVQHWESASITASMCSSASRSLQSTPIRQSNPQPMRMQPPISGEMLSKMQSMNSALMMSPKRDPRVLPQQAVLMQQQGYSMTMVPMQQQLQQSQQPQPQQYQYQSQAMPCPPSYMSQQYVMSAGGGGILRSGPRMLPVNSGAGLGIGNGMIGSGQPPPSSIGYYSQHPAMLSMSHPMAYSTAAGGVGPPIPQTTTNPSQAAAYYGELMQHPLQVPSNPNQPPMNPMMCYNPLVTGSMGMQMDPSMDTNMVFPSAISVQRLTPQVQRQIRETQELIKDSCPQLYGSPGPPQQQQQQVVVPPPPPQRTSTLRKNVGSGQGQPQPQPPGPLSGSQVANNNTSFETHSQEYS